MRAAQRIVLCGLILISAFCFPHFCFAQQALGKHPADKVLPVFYQQNTNASTTAQGLSNSVVPLEAPPVGVRLGGELRTTWPSGGASSNAFLDSGSVAWVTQGGSNVARVVAGAALTNNLYSEAGALTVDSDNRALYDSDGTNRFSWKFGNMRNTAGQIVLQWEDKTFPQGWDGSTLTGIPTNAINANFYAWVLSMASGGLIFNANQFTNDGSTTHLKDGFAVTNLDHAGTLRIKAPASGAPFERIVPSGTNIASGNANWTRSQGIGPQSTNSEIIYNESFNYENGAIVDTNKIAHSEVWELNWDPFEPSLIRQLEWYKVFLGPTNVGNGRYEGEELRMDFANRSGSVTRGFAVNQLNIGHINAVNEFSWIFQPGPYGTGGTLQQLFDTGNLFTTTVGAGGAAFLQAQGTNASVALGVNGGLHTRVSPTALTIVHSGTGNPVFTFNRATPFFEMADGVTAFPMVQLLSDASSGYLLLYTTNAENKVGIRSKGSSFFDGGDVLFGSNTWTAGIQATTNGAAGVGVTNFPNGNITASGTVTGNAFVGDGSGLTALNGTQVTSGTVADARIDAAIARDSEVAAYTNHLASWLTRTQDTRALTLTSLLNLFQGSFRGSIDTNSFKLGDAFVTTKPGVSGDIGIAIGINNALVADGNNQFALGAGNIFHAGTDGYSTLIGIDNHGVFGSGDYSLAFGVANWLMEANAMTLGGFLTNTEAFSVDIGWEDATKATWSASGFTFRNQVIGLAGFSGSGASLTALNDDQVNFDDADNVFTATAVGPALEELNDSINAGVPNGSGAKLHWSQLLGVPAGFADGTDDGGGGGDADAIHDNVGGEIVAITDKATPVAADHLLIEDSAASNAKKDITIASLQTPLEAFLVLANLQGAVTDAQVPNSITVDLATLATTATTANAGDSATAFFSAGTVEAARLPDLSGLNGAVTDAQVPNNITVDLATLATTATTANAGDSATAFFSAGTVEAARLPDLSGLNGAVTDAQVPNSITITLAATATALATPRTIGNVSFDGTANIVPETVAVVDSTDASSSVLIADSATGNLQPKTDAGLTYNASSGTLTATAFSGPLSGNASTATALATPRTIGNVSFDGTANIVPETIAVVDSTDATSSPLMVDSATGNNQPKTDAGLTYNASSGTLAATEFSGGGASLTAINDDQVAFDDADGVFTATAVGPALEELNDSINGGVPNGSGAKTHWSQLLGVPAGFADGTDDGAGGSPFPLTVTTVLITNFASGEQAIVATKDWNSTTNLALDFYFAASRNTLYRDAFGMYFDNFGGASFTFKQGLKVVDLGGSGSRLVQADADGELSATLDASTLASETGENTFISKVRIEGSNDISGRLIITIVTNSQVWNFLMAGNQIITNNNFIFTSSGAMALGQHYSLTVSNSHPSTGLTWTSPTNDLFWPATNAYAGNAFVPAASEVIYDLWFDGAKMNAKVESGPDNTNLVRVAMSFRPVITSGAAGNVLADNGVPDGNTRIYTNGPPSAVGGTVQTNILGSFSNSVNAATINSSNVFQVKTTNDTLALEINTNGLAYFSTGVNVQGTTAGSLQLREPSATGSDYIGWKAPASVTTSYQFVPPAAVASAGLLRAAATASSESAVTVVKLKSYIQLTGFDNATGAIPVNSNDWAAVTYMRPQFLNGTDQASNFIEWRLVVPEDIETTTELRAKLKFRLTGADTGTHRYVLSMVSVADSAAFTGTPGTAINMDFAGDASGASGDVESVGYTTLTGWGAAVTAGQHWVIRLARDGDTSDASTVDSMFGSLVIEYGVAP